MNGGLTQQELELRKIKAQNLDDAVAYLRKVDIPLGSHLSIVESTLLKNLPR